MVNRIFEESDISTVLKYFESPSDLQSKIQEIRSTWTKIYHPIYLRIYIIITIFSIISRKSSKVTIFSHHHWYIFQLFCDQSIIVLVLRWRIRASRRSQNVFFSPLLSGSIDRNIDSFISVYLWKRRFIFYFNSAIFIFFI